MYALSRSLYRELAPMLGRSADAAAGCDDRRHLLAACEEAMRRVVLEPGSYAKPARSLFREIQHLFPLDVQFRALELVRAHVDAWETLSDQLERSLRRDCKAFTRRGSPCRREPQPGGNYCPSHKHLEEVGVSRAAAPAA